MRAGSIQAQRNPAVFFSISPGELSGSGYVGRKPFAGDQLAEILNRAIAANGG
mgnify:CR=1 FL=1